MVSLLHTIKTKGILNTAKRIAELYSRYTFNGFVKSLNSVLDILDDYDAKATFPITAITLERNIDLIREYRDKIIEWAMHGYVHVDYTKVMLKEVEKHIEYGKKIFKNANIELYGFRAPYLKINKEIINLLKSHGFRYDSSYSFFVPVIAVKKSVKKIQEYYNPLKRWKIGNHGGIWEIPASLPDDEIIVDRLGYRGEKIGKVWVRMCNELKKTNAIPVIQLHPERGRLCSVAIKMVLDWANKNNLKVVHLKDIPTLHEKNAIVISGDVDIIKISDLRHMKGEKI